MSRLRTWYSAILLLAWLLPAAAHEGHDHGAADAPPVTGTHWPRAVARSDAVEAVLIVMGGTAVLYLDEALSNAPIGAAQVSVSGEGVADTVWQEVAPAVYTAALALPPGRHALTVVVEAGELVDLLPLTLELPATAPPGEPAATASRGWWWGVAVALGLLAMGLLLWWRRRRGVARAALVSLGLLYAGGAAAHGDEVHDHEHAEEQTSAPVAATTRPPSQTRGAAQPPATGVALPLETPRRLAATQVFVPKSVQRLWGLRTQALRREPLAAQVEWTGRVVADPAASSHLEAPEAGHALPGPGGLPRIGQRVSAGEILLYWQPRRAGLEGERLGAERERLRAQLAQAEARRDRLQQLSGFVAGRELQEATAEVGSLRAEVAALARGVEPRPLRAPIRGAVIVQAVSAGESMEAGTLLLQIADPDRLIVEALAPDASLGALAASAEARWAERDTVLALRLIDGGGAFRGQRVPWRFALLDAPDGLLVGQPLRVRVQAASEREGLTLPRAALQAGEDAAPLAWVHVAPEVFESRRLDVAPLDAERVELRRGASAGERVVVQAAVLLGQVR